MPSKVAIARLVLAHGVACIQNQVQHDLLQLHAIAPYQWKPRRQTSGHRDSAAKQVATKDLDDVVDHVVQRELPGVVPPIGKPAAKFAQHASGTPAVGDDICEDDINFGAVVSAAARAETPGSLGVPKDRRERLTELVRQRRRQHAHRHDATGMRELLAHATEILPFLHRVDGLEIDFRAFSVRRGREDLRVELFGLLLDGVRLAEDLITNGRWALRIKSARRDEREQHGDELGHVCSLFGYGSPEPLNPHEAKPARRTETIGCYARPLRGVISPTSQVAWDVIVKELKQRPESRHARPR